MIKNPFSLAISQVGKTYARVDTTLRVTKVEVMGVVGEKRGRPQPVATPVDRSTLPNPMERTLSELVGSAIVLELQQ